VGAALNAGWYLQAVGQFGALALISIASVALALAVGFYGVSAADPAASTWAAAGLALGPLMLGAGSLAWAFGRLPAEPARLGLAGATRLLVQGRSIFLSQFVAALYSLAGPLVVGALAGVRAAGLYSAVERPAAALQAALNLTHVAAYPRASALYAAGDLAGYRRLLLQVLVVYGVLVAGLGAALLLLGDHPVRFLFGATSHEGTTLLWLAYAWVALGIFGPMVTGYFTVRGTPGEILRLTLAVLLVSLPAGTIGAFYLGGSGWLLAAIAGQCVVVARAVHAWRAATVPTARATLRG
jgi:O-antigen/teichoic acid export membrane protein